MIKLLRSKLDSEVFRYLISGAVVTLGGTGLLTLLLKIMTYPTAYTLVFIFSVLANVILHSKFVFKKTLKNRQSVVFTSLFLQYGIGLTGLHILIDILKVPDPFAPFVNLCFCVPINFLISKAAFSLEKGKSIANEKSASWSPMKFYRENKKACLTILSLTVFTLALFTYNFLRGERIIFNEGLGWDGLSFARWAQMDSYTLLANKNISEYFIGRLLPPILVHNLAALFRYDISTNLGVLKAYFIYNTFCLMIAAATLIQIGRFYKWSTQTIVVSVAAMFFNYSVLKNSSYNPTLTDMSALMFGVITLHAWVIRALKRFVILTFLACFVWPSFVYSLMPLLFFWKFKPISNQNYEPDSRSARNLAALLAVGAAITSLYLFFFEGFRLPSHTNQVNIHRLWLTIPLYILFVFLVQRRFLNVQYFWRLRKHVDYRYAALAVTLFVLVKAIIKLLSSGEVGPLNPALYLGLIAQGGMVNPLTNLVAHISHYGPIITLALFLWSGIQSEVFNSGPGMVVVFIIYGCLSIGTESRQFIPFLPLIVLYAMIELNKRKPDWYFTWGFVLVALALSRFWFMINIGKEWTGKFLEFPDQMLYMYTGPWMSNQMYIVFAWIAVITVVATGALLRSLPRQKEISSGTSKNL